MNAAVKYSIAAAFVILAVGGDAYYTSYLQPKLTNPWVYEASTNIDPNHQITSADITRVQVSRSAVVAGSITDPKTIVGQMASQPIPKNGQFTADNLETFPLAITPGTLSAPITSNSIYAISDSIRRGDYTIVYVVPQNANGAPGQTSNSKVNHYVAAQQLTPVFSSPVPVEFVRNDSNQEVQNASGQTQTSQGKGFGGRENGTSNPSEMELKVTDAEWQVLLADVLQNDKFVFVYADKNHS